MTTPWCFLPASIKAFFFPPESANLMKTAGHIFQFPTLLLAFGALHSPAPVSFSSHAPHPFLGSPGLRQLTVSDSASQCLHLCSIHGLACVHPAPVALSPEALSSPVRIFLLSLSTFFPEGLPQWFSGKESTCSVGAIGDVGSIPGLGRSLRRRAWQPTPVFLPRESHGQRSLVGYSPWGRKEANMT